MEHLYYDLGQQKKGAVAVVTLDKQANVRLMMSSNYRSFSSGRQSRFQGGLATKSPVRLGIPSNDHWYVVVDFGGLPSQVRASVQVQPPPPGLLPPLRDPLPHNPARGIEVRNPADPVDDLLGGQTWDVFLSHAGEDKASVAVPLRDALTARGISVWLDKTEMRIGDSLRRKIDAGIRSSRIGIVGYRIRSSARAGRTMNSTALSRERSPVNSRSYPSGTVLTLPMFATTARPWRTKWP